MGSSIFLAKRGYLATATFRHRRFAGRYPPHSLHPGALRRPIVAAFAAALDTLKLGQKLGERLDDGHRSRRRNAPC
jgi:hypothetical protein